MNIRGPHHIQASRRGKVGNNFFSYPMLRTPGFGAGIRRRYMIHCQGAFYVLMFNFANLEDYPLRRQALAAARFLGDAMTNARERSDS